MRPLFRPRNLTRNASAASFEVTSAASISRRMSSRTSNMGFRLDAKKNPPHLKQGRVDATCAQITATPRFQLEGTSAKKDRKSTRLNSSHVKISYAVFCL